MLAGPPSQLRCCGATDVAYRGLACLDEAETGVAWRHQTSGQRSLAGWVGLETVFRAFDNQLTACELRSQVLQYVSVLAEREVNARPCQSSRIDPVRGDILETI